jgi:hypothetical protein
MLNRVCDEHGHEAGLRDHELRGHVLAAALRAADRTLAAHGYPDADRSLEVLHVAIEDADEDLETEPPARSNWP